VQGVPERLCFSHTGQALGPAENAEFPGQIWDIVALSAGLSANGSYFSEDFVRTKAEKLNGWPINLLEFSGKHYDHLPQEVKDKYPRGVFGNLVGVVESARPGKSPIDGRPAILARARIQNEEAGKLLHRVWNESKQNMPGFSIDVEAVRKVQPERFNAGTGQRVVDIDTKGSLDIVSSPAAGAGFLRLVASMGREDTLKSRLTTLVEKLELSIDNLETTTDTNEILERIITGYTVSTLEEQNFARALILARDAAKEGKLGDTIQMLDALIGGTAFHPKDEKESSKKESSVAHGGKTPSAPDDSAQSAEVTKAEATAQLKRTQSANLSSQLLPSGTDGSALNGVQAAVSALQESSESNNLHTINPQPALGDEPEQETELMADITSIKDFRTAHPDLVARLEAELRTTIEAEQEKDGKHADEINRLTQSVESLDAKFKAETEKAQAEIDGLKATHEKEANEYKAKIEEYEAKDATREKEAQVDRLVMASKLSKIEDEKLREKWLGKEFVGRLKLSKDEADIKTQLAEREQLFATSVTAEGGGLRSLVETDENNTENERLTEAKKREKAFLGAEWMRPEGAESKDDLVAAAKELSERLSKFTEVSQ
jgi:hypothetical protein